MTSTAVNELRDTVKAYKVKIAEYQETVEKIERFLADTLPGLNGSNGVSEPVPNAGRGVRRFTPDEVRRMRQEYFAGGKAEKLAKKYGIHFTSFYNLVKGRTYGWVK